MVDVLNDDQAHVLPMWRGIWLPTRLGPAIRHAGQLARHLQGRRLPAAFA